MDLRHLIGYAAPYRWPLALAACVMLLEAGAMLALPWLGGQLAAGVLLEAGHDLQLLLWALLAVLGWQALLRFANGYIAGPRPAPARRAFLTLPTLSVACRPDQPMPWRGAVSACSAVSACC
jgi:hypothetical protein